MNKLWDGFSDDEKAEINARANDLSSEYQILQQPTQNEQSPEEVKPN